MTDSFSDLELLSKEDLIVEAFEAIRKILDTYEELNRRDEITRSFLKNLCSISIETQIWFTLWESGGAQRFTDIFRLVDCSRKKLTDVLHKLWMIGLIQRVEKRYQAVSPAWLVHKMN